jgi:hypothetical protein
MDVIQEILEVPHDSAETLGYFGAAVCRGNGISAKPEPERNAFD